jgi:HPt (histidine-containing phosphotransfer) domain-containing protein
MMPETIPYAEPIYSTLNGDPGLAEIVDLFVEEMPGRIATLREHFEADDWDGLRRTAHQLKGAAGSYGFERISPCAAELEDAIDEGLSEEEIGQLFDRLVAICQSVRGGTPA